MLFVIRNSYPSFFFGTFFFFFFFFVVVFISLGCGGGLVGIGTGLSSTGGSGGVTSTPSVVDLVLLDTKASPAVIRFRISDILERPVDVEIDFGLNAMVSCETEEGSQVRLVEGKYCDLETGAVIDVDTRLKMLQTSGNGTLHTKLWDFVHPDQLGEKSLTENVRIKVSLSQGNCLVQSTNLGNDPPVIDSLAVNTTSGNEVTGVAPVAFFVSDTSSDDVTVDVTYRIEGGPDGCPCQATSAGGETAFEVVTSPEKTRETFFWDVVQDLGFTEHLVTLRFVPRDRTECGAAQYVSFRVDNNSSPIAVLDSSNIILQNTDQRRGLPLPCHVIDGNAATRETGDSVGLLFQWRRFNEAAFRRLPNLTANTLQEFSESASKRKRFRVCTEMPIFFHGRARPTADSRCADSKSIRLPELATSAAPLVRRKSADSTQSSSRFVSGDLELLRGSNVPKPASLRWSQTPDLVQPVAALPLGDGLTAVVLERLEAGHWRLRSIRLGNGEILEEIASGDGDPSTMTFDSVARPRASPSRTVNSIVARNRPRPDRRGGPPTVLIAVTLDGNGTWQIRRVSHDINLDLITADGSTQLGAVRGLVSLGSEVGLITVGDSLIRLDYSLGSDGATANVLFGPGSPEGSRLDLPWGLVVDPLRRHLIYVSEKGRDRVLAIDLTTMNQTEVVTTGIGLPAPESIALEETGRRLLVLTDQLESEGRELRGIELNGGADVDEDGRADASVFQIFPSPGQSGYPGEVGMVATGQEGLRILALTSDGDLAIGGGVEQRRTIDPSFDYDPQSQTVCVLEDFDPRPRPFQPFRVGRTLGTVQAKPQGTAVNFVWDNRDVEGGGEVFVRAIPFDSDRGTSSEAGPKTLLPPLLVEPLIIPDPAPDPDQPCPAISFRINFAIAADLDADGDLDIVAAVNNRQTKPGEMDPGEMVPGGLRLFFQESPGRFALTPRPKDGLLVKSPSSVAVTDLTGDGRPDLIVADVLGNQVVIFFQDPSLPDLFDDDPNDPIHVQILGRFEITNGPSSVAVADMDRNGKIDIITANRNGNDLRIFYRPEMGDFSDNYSVAVGGLGSTPAPTSLAIADVDGDGELDLVTANADNNTLTVLFQTGPREFARELVLGRDTITGPPEDVVVADFDGDGHPDILSANSFGGGDDEGSDLTLFFLRAGQIDSSILVNPLRLGNDVLTNGPVSLAIGDFDRNGTTDIVSANFAGNNLALFRQLRPGIFDRRPVILGGETTTPGPLTVATGDLDGDGDLDVLSGNAGSVTVFSQTSAGVFDPLGAVVVDGAADPSRQVCFAVADLDQDGDLDLVTANTNLQSQSATTNNLAVFRQRGPGVFDQEPRVTLQIPGTTERIIAVEAADLDGDGDVDLVSSNRDSLTIFFQTKLGIFRVEDSLVIRDPRLCRPKGIAVADLNGDGRLDLVTTSDENSLIIFDQSAEPGKFDLVRPLLDPHLFPSDPRSVAVADFDQDGRLDLVSANFLSDDVTIFFQDARGTFESPPVILGGSDLTGQPFVVLASDLDGDGDFDLATANAVGDLTVFLLSTSGSTEVSVESVQKLGRGEGKTNPPRSLAAADLDGDGDLDLAVANRESNDVKVFFQTGPGVFDPDPIKLSFGVGANEDVLDPLCVRAADCDGDGDLDLATVSLDGRRVQIRIFYGSH